MSSSRPTSSSRWAIFGDFENPYLTFKPAYEQGILEIFAELVGNGLVYKQLKPIHWSVGCETALADAELEYKDIASASIFVNFPMDDEAAAKVRYLGLAAGRHTGLLYDLDDHALDAGGQPGRRPASATGVCRPHLRAKTARNLRLGRGQARLEPSSRPPGWKKASTASASRLGRRVWRACGTVHPYVEANPTDKDCWFAINADYVTTEDGTGIVHIAPGHGVEDYMAGMNNGLACIRRSRIRRLRMTTPCPSGCGQERAEGGPGSQRPSQEPGAAGRMKAS
jgi:isoleucyl-tRNA synthetase